MGGNILAFIDALPERFDAGGVFTLKPSGIAGGGSYRRFDAGRHVMLPALSFIKRPWLAISCHYNFWTVETEYKVAKKGGYPVDNR